MGKWYRDQYSVHYTKDSSAEVWCIYVLLFSLVNVTIPEPSSLVASSRHQFPFNCWKRIVDSGKEKKIEEGNRKRNCFSKLNKVHQGDQTTQNQSCCCQPCSCSFWCLMLSIIPLTYSLKDVTLLTINVYFSSSICLKRVLERWSWAQRIIRVGLKIGLWFINHWLCLLSFTANMSLVQEFGFYSVVPIRTLLKGFMKSDVLHFKVLKKKKK